VSSRLFGAIARFKAKLAALVKGQVFSMSLNRRKFAEKTHGLIRRKYFVEIEAGHPQRCEPRPYFRNHIGAPL
jgi:hypothetical protein